MRARGERYGRWAVVAGASEGLGAAFAEALAQRGYSLLLLARRDAVLAELAAQLRAAHGAIEVRTAACDLAAPDLATRLATETAGLEVGVAVYNAAFAPIGPMIERPLDELLRSVDVNVRGPVCFARTLVPPMVARGRGALVLMSSLVGWQGSPRLATYAASKAFNTVLGEGLWAELRPHGVDVVATAAGAIRTPGYLKGVARDVPGVLSSRAVAERTLDGLGRGPVVTPGALNKVAGYVVGRLLPRRAAIAVMGASTRTVT